MSFKVSPLLVGFAFTNLTLWGEEPRAIVPEKHLYLLYHHCMDCHNADTQKGKVNLEDLPNIIVGFKKKLYENLITKIKVIIG